MPHPNPLTAIQVEIDLERAVAHKKNLVYSLWDQELFAEVITSTCVYGYPSCVIVVYSLSNGVTALQWSPYEQESNIQEDLFNTMVEWIADQITTKATGTQFAVGNFSNIVVEDRPRM